MNASHRIVLAVAGLAALTFAACQPDYPKCEKDEHCHEAEFCVNGLCQQCRGAEDCAAGQECAAGACREIPGWCRDSASCAEGQVCRDQRCGPCMSNAECASGLACLDGRCGKAECQTTNDCAAGLSCIDYRCQEDAMGASGIGPGDCAIAPVYFEFDSAELVGEARAVVERDAACLVKRGGKAVVEGHCDARGTTEYNLALGDRRANIVKKMLVTLGVDGKNLRAISKGEEEASGRDEEGMKLDRRADIE